MVESVHFRLNIHVNSLHIYVFLRYLKTHNHIECLTHYHFPGHLKIVYAISLHDTGLSRKVDFYCSKISRRSFKFGDSWFIYFCPQSVFKVHPLYDYVLADIITLAVSVGINAHLGK